MKKWTQTRFYRIAVLTLVILLSATTSAFAANETEPNNTIATADHADPLSINYGSVGGGDIDYWRLAPNAQTIELTNYSTENLYIEITVTVGLHRYTLYTNTAFPPGSQFITINPSYYFGATDVHICISSLSFGAPSYKFVYYTV